MKMQNIQMKWELQRQNVKLDFTKAQAFKDGVVKKLTGGVEGLLKGNKVEYVQGEAYFVDATQFV